MRLKLTLGHVNGHVPGGDHLVKGVQCHELFGGIALKNHAFSFFFHFMSTSINSLDPKSFFPAFVEKCSPNWTHYPLCLCKYDDEMTIKLFRFSIILIFTDASQWCWFDIDGANSVPRHFRNFLK